MNLTSVATGGQAPPRRKRRPSSRSRSPQLRAFFVVLRRQPSLARSLLINDPSRVFIARHGRHELTNLVLASARVQELVESERMLKSSRRRIDLSHPFVDAHQGRPSPEPPDEQASSATCWEADGPRVQGVARTLNRSRAVSVYLVPSRRMRSISSAVSTVQGKDASGRPSLRKRSSRVSICNLMSPHVPRSTLWLTGDRGRAGPDKGLCRGRPAASPPATGPDSDSASVWRTWPHTRPAVRAMCGWCHPCCPRGP
jgi:hypothetical protein